MPYKDAEKQKEANRRAQERRRNKGMTAEGMTVTPEPDLRPGVNCLLNWGPYLDANTLAKLSKQRGQAVYNRVASPGDPDYKGVCTQDEDGSWHVTGKHQPTYDSNSTSHSNHTLTGAALIEHLEAHTVDELKAEGYWIPAWKQAGKTYKEAV